MPVLYVDFLQSAQSIGQLLQRRAQTFPQQIALRYLSHGEESVKTIDYATLHERAKSIASTLEQVVRSGERAILMYSGDIEYACALFACVYAGITAVPILPVQNKREMKKLKTIISETNPRLLLTTEHGMELLGEKFWHSACAKNIWPVMTDSKAHEMHRIYQDRTTGPEEIAIIDYFHTLNGENKAHYLSHRELLDRAQRAVIEFNVSRSDTVVSWLSPFSGEGLIIGLLTPLYRGCEAIWFDRTKFNKSPLQLLEIISSYGVTISGGTSRDYERCLEALEPKAVEKLNLSSWRVAFTGAQPLRETVRDALSLLLAPTGFSEQAFGVRAGFCVDGLYTRCLEMQC